MCGSLDPVEEVIVEDHAVQRLKKMNGPKSVEQSVVEDFKVQRGTVSIVSRADLGIP